MSAWRLLLTRSADDNRRMSQTLAARNVHTSALAMLDIAPLEETAAQRSLLLDLDRYHGVVVVSRPAAHLGLERLDRYWPQPPRQAWFAIGDASATPLRDYGLDVTVACDGGTSEDLLQEPALAELLRDSAAPRLLIWRGEGGREQLADSLRGQGVHVDYLELYRRRWLPLAAAELQRRVEAERLNGVVVSSGQGLAHLRDSAGAYWPRLCQLTFFTPSQRVADLARDWGVNAVADCRGASGEAVVSALTELAEPND